MEEENGDAIFDTHFKTTRTYHTILYIIFLAINNVVV